MTAACWLCGGATGADDDLGDLGFVRCAQCGFVFRPDLDPDALAQIYEGDEYGEDRAQEYMADGELQDRRRDARVRLGYIAPFAQGGTLLDVGASTGAFVAEAAAAGFDAWGIEPTPSYARLAREQLGVDVRDGMLERHELEPGGLAAVTLWHVLEHIREPLGPLRLLRDALADGGILALEVPNAGGAMARHEGAAWESLQPDVHVSQFTPDTLRIALERAGLRVLDISTVPITPYLTARARLDPRHVAYRVKTARWRGLGGYDLLRAAATPV
jgi:2-polyprenyl-3-methyl-5-hydroxy-6-metoxy-1,4-benzoquinol methylase